MIICIYIGTHIYHKLNRSSYFKSFQPTRFQTLDGVTQQPRSPEENFDTALEFDVVLYDPQCLSEVLLGQP